MQRLYYEKKYDPTQPEGLAGEAPKIDDYLNKVAHLVPSEVIAGYLTMIGFVDTIKNAHTQNGIAWAVFALGIILTPFYLNNVAEADKPKRNHLILSTVAFIVWAYVTTGKQLVPNFFDQAIASIVLIAFSLVSAVIPLNK